LVIPILDWSIRFRAMKHRNFQLFIIGQLISLVGTWMQNTAQQWLVYRLTGSAALLGVFAFASQFPMLCLAWMGGYVGDRYNRHRGVITTQTVSMILAFVLALLTLTHLIKTWHLIVIAFLVGIVNAFDVPIRQAFFVHMVGKDDLPNAIALNSSIFNGARVIGPAVAGLAIALVGEGWCFFINGLSFVAVIIALQMMHIEPTDLRGPKESPVRSFIEGFRFAMNDVPIRSALLLLSLLSFFGLQYSVFLPIYASDILHGGARTLGLLMSAAGVGAVLGALHFAARTEYKGLARCRFADFFVRDIVLGLRCGAFPCRLCRHLSNGGYEYHYSATRSRQNAQPPDGRICHLVHGSDADWRAHRRRGGETYRRAAHHTYFWAGSSNRLHRLSCRVVAKLKSEQPVPAAS
jgi:MFS family permease